MGNVARADVGDIEAAAGHLAIAEVSAIAWQGTAWRCAMRPG